MRWNFNKKIKEIRFKPGIAGRDLQIRINQAKKFLEKGYKVRVTVLFWGKHSDRKTAIDYAEPKLELFKALGKIVQQPQTVGRRMTMLIERRKS